MNTFLLKINEPARKDDNIYIIQSNDIIKVGYTSNLVSRMMQYYYHNPNTVFIGSAYREDAESFEKQLHSRVKSTILNEWYPKDMLELLIEYVTNTTPLPEKEYVKRKASSTKGKNIGKAVSPKTIAKQQALQDFLKANPNGTYPLYCSMVPVELQYNRNKFGMVKKF